MELAGVGRSSRSKKRWKRPSAPEFSPSPIRGTIGRYVQSGTELDSIGVFTSSGLFENLAGTGWPGNGYGFGFVPPAQLPGNLGTIQPGQTWYFQLWHRDTGGTSNLSTGLAVTYWESTPWIASLRDEGRSGVGAPRAIPLRVRPMGPG